MRVTRTPLLWGNLNGEKNAFKFSKKELVGFFVGKGVKREREREKVI